MAGYDGNTDAPCMAPPESTNATLNIVDTDMPIPGSPDALSPPNSNVFDGEQGTRGYRINQLAQSMRSPENRKAFLADEAGYMTRMGLTDAEQALVRARDWYGMQAAGGNQYALVKLGGALGINLMQQGAQMRGETFAEFMRTRPVSQGRA